MTPAAFAERFQTAQTLLQAGRLPEAIALYDALLHVAPQDAACLHMRGLAAAQSGQFGAACVYLTQAVAQAPTVALYHCNLGLAHKLAGQVDAAMRAYDQALALQPDYAEAHYNRGNLHAQLGQHTQALTDYTQALARAPQHADCHNNRGLSQQAVGDYAGACASYAQAIALRPAFAEAHYNQGNALQKLGRYAEAVASYQHSIALRPQHPDAWCNLGVAQGELGEIEAALASYDRAIALRQGFAQAYYQRGNLLYRHQRVTDAIASYDQAIAQQPDFDDAQWNKSLALLLLGNFAEGWALYEGRWSLPGFSTPKRDFGVPQWRGDFSLRGRRILLHSEQGLGDTLQFCRYGTLLAEQGAEVILEVPAELVSLCASLPGVSQVLPWGRPLPVLDAHCPLLSLPLACGTRLESIPAFPSYLFASEAAKAIWAERLGPASALRVGLVWRGSPSHRGNHKRSIPLATLLSHLPRGPEYLCLQQEIDQSERALLSTRPDVRLFPGLLTDFAATAALCAHLDLVISIDTSVAHLAAALGRTTWILLPYAPDWRWLLQRDDNPWYPSVRLFRQENEGQWAAALQALGEALAGRC
ncbi:MAG: tetratricopeptide repeat protein [Rhodocyclales bacterium]|nr:tetratricopeptide repeat protein [Rhodocyclales bacterium]